MAHFNLPNENIGNLQLKENILQDYPLNAFKDDEDYFLDLSFLPTSHTIFPIKIQKESFVIINRIRVYYFFSNSLRIEEFVDNCSVQFALINKSKKLLGVAQTGILREFCLHTNTLFKAEKLFKRIPIITSTGEAISLEVF